MRNHSWNKQFIMSKNRKILLKFRWFGIGTFDLNQNFGSIQTRAIILIFISILKFSIIFNSGRIKDTWKTAVFRKILTLLRKWRHSSAVFQKYSKVKPETQNRSFYLDCVFLFQINILLSSCVKAKQKRHFFLQYYKLRQMSYNMYVYESQNRKG